MKRVVARMIVRGALLALLALVALWLYASRPAELRRKLGAALEQAGLRLDSLASISLALDGSLRVGGLVIGLDPVDEPGGGTLHVLDATVHCHPWRLLTGPFAARDVRIDQLSLRVVCPEDATWRAACFPRICRG
jgi:hypothetical protein